LGLFTVLETFIYRFATTKNRDFILDDNVFEKFSDELGKLMKKHCDALGICDKGLRGALKSNLKCLNRYSFKDNLTMFLGHYKIGYRDIIDDLGVLIKVRDNITHRGISEREFDNLIEAYYKLMALVQRIFLATLNYKGSYWNWINKNTEPFKKDPNNDWI
jgi:hypothetical protein